MALGSTIRLFCVLLLADQAAGLRDRSKLPKFEATAPDEKVLVRQELGNLRDMQYFGTMSIGGQKLKVILDTGSFEIVAFRKRCFTCGVAAMYDESASMTFLAGNLTQVHSYGSGSCEAMDGYDNINIGGGLSARRQPLWVATNCQIPMLSKASFNAIAGLGPPGQPVFTAERELRAMKNLEQELKDKHEAVPKHLLTQKAVIERALAAARTKPAMLENLGVETFSTCLGRAPESPGYLIWNDETRKGVEGVTEIPIAGNITWGVSMKDFKFSKNGKELPIGCEEGCGAIVDTGTSLFAVPSQMHTTIAMLLNSLGVNDCTDLQEFPDLVMTLGGREIRFPPSTYLGTFYGEMDREVSEFVSTESLTENKASCQLLLMDLGPSQKTTLGPMLVLGMPFFREYYTTFDLGTGRGDRSLFVSPATDGCEPQVNGVVANDRVGHSLRHTPRKVDASVLRVPKWAKHNFTEM